ncbi:NDxxF motif lipoprotein [Alkalihalobacillus sp. 1P02AB]|uniref:NDxxF motif lipoprotein n=1 Tax=Alkalihalobacillus sp. 1P02AB TaxID=3132260 RepID=UPI0039A5C3D0
MRRIIYSFLMILILSACSQGGNITAADDEVILPKNVEIPSIIFTSEKENSVIDEDEIKASIKTYLDSDEDVYNASYPFRDIIYERQELNEDEIEKLDRMNKLIKENDENFSNYIFTHLDKFILRK